MPPLLEADAPTRFDLPQQQVEQMVRQRDFTGIRELCKDWEPYDLARMIDQMPDELEAVAFRVLPRDQAADVFERMDYPTQEHLLKALGNETVASLLNEMSPDDRTALFEELPAPASKRMLELLSKQERHIALKLLGYPEDSIGRLMTPDFIGIKAAWTIGQALARICDVGHLVERIDVVYVMDDQGKLLDEIPVRELLIHPTNTPITDLMDQSLVSLYAGESQESAVQLMQETDLAALPVVDSTDKLIGVVTFDDMMDVAEEQATEDMQMVGGTEGFEEPYLEVSLWKLYLKRAPWLTILFIGGMLTANAMAIFETEIEKAAVLIIFLPLIIASGGNSGSQATTLVIRALALGQVSLRDWFRILWREMRVALLLGLTLAVIGVIRIAIGAQFGDTFTEFWLHVSYAVGAALIGVVLWGSIVGAMLPLLLNKLGLDPATSSAPFVATLVDVTGIMIYFSVAMYILQGKLL